MRRGFALAAALVALVLIAVLVTGALFASNQETHASRAELADEQAFAFAERAATIAASRWVCPGCDLLPVGSVIVQTPTPSPPLESTVYITRLDSSLFLVTGEGRIMQAGTARIRRRVSIAVTISRDSAGAVTARRLEDEFWSAAYRM